MSKGTDSNRSPPNPFTVFTPEGMSAEHVLAIFATVPGLNVLKEPGHAFVHGVRGSGKSILFRYLEPDCQMRSRKASLDSLPYFAAYVTFRETDVQIAELDRFKNRHGDVFLNEHLLVLTIATRTTMRLLRHGVVSKRLECKGVEQRLADLVLDRMKDGQPTSFFQEQRSSLTQLEALRDKLQAAYMKTMRYIKQHSFRQELLDYDGELFGFDDFLLPYFEILRSRLALRPELPFYLLLDDGDSLTETQATVVNSWIARRQSTECSIKVAAQLTAYKTYVTTSGLRIEAPHDFHNVQLSESRTGDPEYRQRMARIVAQRLRHVGLKADVEEFFPEDEKQREAIREIAAQLRRNWAGGRGDGPRGARARDDVQRYARPNYIAALGGARKSRSKYSYSGFGQLVHLSSGVPRFFLEAAADMYDRAVASRDHVPIARTPPSIAPHIQNEVVREHAEGHLLWDIDDLKKDVVKLYKTPKRAVRLHNLINAIGAIFEQALLNRSASERKFFSFTFSDRPDEQSEDVLQLGIRYGYLSKRLVGRKEGFGRTYLYEMSRRLAPLFNLDPMGIAAYKSFSNAEIHELMDFPDRARRKLAKTRYSKEPPIGDHQTELPLAGRDELDD